jgi:predicted nuclease of restriction endonuclease-like (RecB) superfamily
MEFKNLSFQIKEVHHNLYQKAIKAVNTHLIVRNWIIGMYIVEFEQNGSDRASYGTQLLQKLAKDIAIKGLSAPELSRCRQFYQTYPQILGSLTQEFKYLLPQSIVGALTQQLENYSQLNNINLPENYYKELISNVSFTHFAELIKIKDTNKRIFYEMMILKNTLSVRELEKQIVTLAYERVGLSQNAENSVVELQSKITPSFAEDAVKSIYFFDFLNLPSQHLIQESQLEEALINHLEKFILELGNGFCFETRQKRILIDQDYCFIDLVFYHRIIKCHILLELKVDKFKHEYLSQLNSYVAYYNDKEKREDDNPTIGILLCTEKGTQMVEYAMAGMTQKLFVSKYLVELPSKETLAKFLENELSKL